MAAVLPGKVKGSDLECRDCRLFYARVQYTAQSIYHLRIRKLASAVLRA